MGSTTEIAWTDSTWNPIRGCSRVSEGCRNCYAERAAYRFSGPGRPYEGLAHKVNGHAAWTGKVEFAEKHLLDPLKWRTVKDHDDACEHKRQPSWCMCPSRPRRIFVNSMSDLFHENVPDEWIDRIFAVMALCPQHAFQVLTKRPERMLAYCSTLGKHHETDRVSLAMKQINSVRGAAYSLTPSGWAFPNVHLGVSVEDQKTADERIPLLLQTPAAVRFISAEPLLGAMDLSILPRPEEFHRSPYGWHQWWPKKLHWVIVGGESGPGARPMHPDWARSLRDQCQAAGVPFFFKQWGEWLPAMTDGAETSLGVELNCSDEAIRVGKKRAGSLLDGREWREFPEAAQ